MIYVKVKLYLSAALTCTVATGNKLKSQARPGLKLESLNI